MTLTGHSERDRLVRVESMIARDAQAATARIRQAWSSYSWTSLPSLTQAAAWARLLSFTSHLLGIQEDTTQPQTQAVATQALMRWFKICGIATGHAIERLLNTEAVPDTLLELLENAAIVDANSQIFERVMELTYGLRSPAERESSVRELLAAFPLVEEYLEGTPPWSLIEELPAIHRLCLEELQRAGGKDAVKSESLNPWQNRPDAQTAHHHPETEPV
jgi:hypothetical protein